MTSNPMTKSRVYENIALDSEPMTVSGAVNKTLILLLITAVTSCFTWNVAASGMLDKAQILIWTGLILGFILAIVTSFKPDKSPVLAPVYAICEGLAVGGISYMYNTAFYPGIVLQAVVGTFLALFTMLVLYKTGLIKATNTFRKVVITSTFAIAIYYIVGLIASLLGHPMTSFGTPFGIGVSVVICAIASLNFILDFDFIENGANRLAPKYFEWYGGFALLVTTIWLYFEILRLLAQLSSRR